MEPYETRLARLREGSPTEAILSLVNSQGIYLIDIELTVAAQHGLSTLLILGIHSIAKTWIDLLYPEQRAVDGFREYLRNFVDGEEPDKKFSEIASEINRMRNIIAHQWFSQFGYTFGRNLEMSEGWKREGEAIYINPIVYFQCFKVKFGMTAAIIKELFSEEQREQIKQRIIDGLIGR